MKRIMIMVSALAMLFVFTACGSGSNTSQGTGTVEIRDLGRVASIDCRSIKEYGGEVKLRAKLEYESGIKIDSFTYTYAIDGNIVDFETPIVTFSRDGNTMLIDGDMYIMANETSTPIIHVFELTYLDGGEERLFRGGCKQGVYISAFQIAPTTQGG